ncbi:MAG: hypothetical protein ACJAXJ_001167 [Colwellia sp.]|jgi:hypothetical protein
MINRVLLLIALFSVSVNVTATINQPARENPGSYNVSVNPNVSTTFHSKAKVSGASCSVFSTDNCFEVAELWYKFGSTGTLSRETSNGCTFSCDDWHQVSGSISFSNIGTYFVEARFIAENGEQKSVWWEVSVEVPNQEPNAPGIPYKTGSSRNSLGVAWSAASDPDGDSISLYEIAYDCTSLISPCLEKTTTTSSRSITISGLDAGKSYEFRVKAKDSEGEWGNWSQWSSGISTDLPNQEPSQPGLISISTIIETGAIISWLPATDPDNDSLTYTLKVGVNNIPGWDQEIDAGSNTSVDVSNLDPNTEYTVEVVVSDGDLSNSRQLDPAFTTSSIQMFSAYWQGSLTREAGELVRMAVKVDGFNEGDIISFQVFEDDWIGDEAFEPIEGTVFKNFDGYFAVADWQAVWREDASGDPEYYFIATAEGITKKSDSLLTVTPSTKPDIVFFAVGDAENSIAFTPTPVTTYQDTLFEVGIKNNSTVAITQPFEVVFYDDSTGEPIEKERWPVSSLHANESRTLGAKLLYFKEEREFKYRIVIDEVNSIDEGFGEDNNILEDVVSVRNSNNAKRGLTVITHGFQAFGLLPDWTLAMAEAVQDRAMSNGSNANIWQYTPSTASLKLLSPSPAVIGEDIIVFDWAKESNNATSGYSEAAGEALFATLMANEQNGLIKLENIHFIGHSRGTVVNSEAVQRLIAVGKNIAQVTTLDPHDWGAADLANDYDVNPEYQNVDFNARVGVINFNGIGWFDNYYQQDSHTTTADVLCPGGLSGREIEDGAANKKLIADFGHCNVHELYYGTIAPFSEIPNSNWYQSNNLDRNRHGYNLSRLGRYTSEQTGENGLDNSFNKTEQKFSEFSWTKLGHGIVNGNLARFNVTNIPSWQYHGEQQTTATKVFTESGDRLFRLDKDNALLAHNPIYVPLDVIALKYKGCKLTSDNAGHLDVLFGNQLLKSSLLAELSNGCAEYYVDLSDVQGKVEQLVFSLRGELGEVEIDDLQFATTILKPLVEIEIEDEDKQITSAIGGQLTLAANLFSHSSVGTLSSYTFTVFDLQGNPINIDNYHLSNSSGTLSADDYYLSSLLSFTTAGNYIITLSVTDSLGNNQQTSWEINVVADFEVGSSIAFINKSSYVFQGESVEELCDPFVYTQNLGVANINSSLDGYRVVLQKENESFYLVNTISPLLPQSIPHSLCNIDSLEVESSFVGKTINFDWHDQSYGIYPTYYTGAYDSDVSLSEIELSNLHENSLAGAMKFKGLKTFKIKNENTGDLITKEFIQNSGMAFDLANLFSGIKTNYLAGVTMPYSKTFMPPHRAKNNLLGKRFLMPSNDPADSTWSDGASYIKLFSAVPYLISDWDKLFDTGIDDDFFLPAIEASIMPTSSFEVLDAYTKAIDFITDMSNRTVGSPLATDNIASKSTQWLISSLKAQGMQESDIVIAFDVLGDVLKLGDVRPELLDVVLVTFTQAALTEDAAIKLDVYHQALQSSIYDYDGDLADAILSLQHRNGDAKYIVKELINNLASFAQGQITDEVATQLLNNTSAIYSAYWGSFKAISDYIGSKSNAMYMMGANLTLSEMLLDFGSNISVNQDLGKASQYMLAHELAGDQYVQLNDIVLQNTGGQSVFEWAVGGAKTINAVISSYNANIGLKNVALLKDKALIKDAKNKLNGAVATLSEQATAMAIKALELGVTSYLQDEQAKNWALLSQEIGFRHINAKQLTPSADILLTKYEDNTPLSSGVISFVSSKLQVIEGGDTNISISRSGGNSGRIEASLTSTVNTDALISPLLPLSVIFEDGEDQKSILISNFDDSEYHGDRRITLMLVGEKANSSTLDLTLMENDQAPEQGVISFTQSFLLVNENEGAVDVKLIRQGGTSDSISVDFATADLSAFSGHDYIQTSGTVTFLAGETEKLISITLVDDLDNEENEAFELNVFGNNAANLTKLTIYIKDEDNVILTNTKPEAYDLTISRTQNEDISGFVLASDQEDDTIEYSVITHTVHGTITLNRYTGEFLYLPDNTFDGNDSFTFKVFDGEFDSNVATVTINVTAGSAENQKPTIQITSPDDNAVLNNDETSIQFTGTANDEDGSIQAINYRIDNGEWTTATGTENWNFTLTELAVGQHSIDVHAVDNLDLPGTDTRYTITRKADSESLLPEIVVNGGVLFELENETSVFSVSGQASYKNGEIALVEYRYNDLGWQLATGTSNWSISVDNLKVGDNNLTIRAQETKGLKSLDTQVVITRQANVNNQIPELAINSPDSNIDVDYTISQYSISGNASDLDGTIEKLEFTLGNGIWQSIQNESNWSFVANLAYGLNTISVRAQDNSGAYSLVSSIDITREHEPVAPLPYFILETDTNMIVDNAIEQVAIIGSVWVDPRLTVSYVEYRINSGEWMFAPVGQQFTIVISNLALGETEIELRALDSASNANLPMQDDKVIITRLAEGANEAPNLVITSPTQTSYQGTLSPDNLIITGTANDSDGSIAGVYYRVNSSEWTLLSGLENWQLQVTQLVEGDNLFEFKAIDNALLESNDPYASVNVVAISGTQGTILTLNDGDSYDFSERKLYDHSFGDFYYLSEKFNGIHKFWANNGGQRGVIDLGVLNDLTPSTILLPLSGFQAQGVSIQEQHSYLSLAQEGEEGNVIFFTVLQLSDSSVTIDYQYLPESSFIVQEAKLIASYAVEDAILQACIENVTDEFTYIHEVTELTCLDYPNIASLTGLEHFTALEKLQLLNTNITELAPISQLNTLNVLVITGGSISDLSPITSLNNLSHLVLQQLEISDISALAEMTNLKLLTLSGNNIADIIALEKLTKLTNLYLSDNQISDISPLKNLLLLQEFDLRFNQGITCVDVSEYFHSIDELPESCLISSTLDTDLDGIPDIEDIFPNDSSMHLTLKTSGDGTGVIEIPDSGVSCEQECTIQLILGTEYSVNVIPDYGSAVLGWDGSENLICINGSSPSYCNDIAISGYVTAQINFDIDTDLDGQGNSVDTDDDGDGVEDSFDAFPLDATESVDTDLDGIGNNADLDDDGDKYLDADEVAAGSDPLNGESLPLDTDGDFISDVTDTDDDNDGVIDASDAFPLDATESVDTDLDGIGNNADTDDDGDGIIDTEDESPLDNTVGDSQAPIFGEILELTFEAKGVTTVVELVEPEVTDNNLNAPTVMSDYSDALSLGTHEITWTATDFAGNTATAIQQIHIVDTTAPEFDEAQTQTINARGLMTNITDDIAFVAHDIVDGDIAVQIVGDTVLSSGKHLVVVSAEDASGNVVEANTHIHINPLVELTQNTKVEPGATIEIPVYLTGDAAVYPVVIDYAITGVDLLSNNYQLIVEAGEKAAISMVIPSTAVNGEVATVALTSAVNAVLGKVRDIELLVVAENYSPTLQVTLEQNNKPITVVDAQGGVVTVTATINDMNALDSHDIAWSASNNALVDLGIDNLATTFEFSPESLESNTYGLSVQVKENNTSELYEISVATDVVVDADLATLSDDTDSDNDGIPDVEEGYADSDQDGIADYLDDDDNPSHLPIGNDSAPMQTINGLTLSLGDVVSSANGVIAQNAAVDINDITENGGENGAEVTNSLDAHFEALSTIINFNLSGLSEVGITVPVVIPLADGDVISLGSIYRKYNATRGWYNFVEDDDNAILSALTDSDGNCPAPLSNEYKQGLNVGDNCIELLIKDGGENDADGLANGMIKDPGALATETPNQAPVINLVNAIEVNEITDVTLDASATTDAENDTLTFLWTQLSGSEVSLSGTDTALLSFVTPSVSNNELLTFELVVNDGRDSVTATAEVLVLQVNVLPTVSIDTHASSFNEGTSISLSADEDNDTLTYLWKQVSGPNITLSDNTLASISFTAPEVTSNQTIVFKVTVSDGTDSVSATTSFVVNNVVAPVTPPKESSGGGGGSMAWLLILLGLASLRGKEYRR